MANIRSRLSASEALAAGSPYLRSALAISEVAQGGSPNLRSRLAIVETATGGFPDIRSRLAVAEVIQGGSPNLRSRLVIVEVLLPVLEGSMSTEVFPLSGSGSGAVLGLSWDVHKSPIFNNKIATHTSGEETATAYYQNPKWEYKLTYDYLPDVPKSVGDTDLHTILGFFLNRRGRWDTFLFLDPDDNAVAQGYQADFDGTVVEFNLVRGIGGFYEPVGQLNTDEALSVWLAVTEDFTVPASPGPYTVTVSQAAAYTQTDSVTINGVAATLATGAPAAGQYSVAAGVFTFNAADTGKAVVIRYRYLVDPADYSVTMPNLVVFTSAPPNLATAYASFNFYFVCRFTDDTADFDKFAAQLWELQEISLRSIPSQ